MPYKCTEIQVVGDWSTKMAQKGNPWPPFTEMGGDHPGFRDATRSNVAPWEWPIFHMRQLRHSQGGLKRPTGPNITERPKADRISPNTNVT